MKRCYEKIKIDYNLVYNLIKIEQPYMLQTYSTKTKWLPRHLSVSAAISSSTSTSKDIEDTLLARLVLS